MLLKKQDIRELKLQELATKNLSEVAIWCESHNLSHFSTWTLAQMVAEFGSWTCVKTDGMPNAVETLKRNIGDDAWKAGLWKLTRIKRSSLLARQVAQPDYGAFTPLILMGFKRMQGIGYEQWRDSPGLEHILEPDLYNAVVLDDYSFVNLGSDRLLEIRQKGLKVKTGPKAGSSKSPESTWSLSDLKDTEIYGIPKLTQTMICQCWLAHPKNRTNYMILDPSDWDRMPEPLATTDIFKKPEQPPEIKKAPAEDTAALPWM